jgi:Phage tail tube protein, GTA-gp10
MANPWRAETDLKTPQQIYPLRLNMNDIALLENELGYGIYEFVNRVGAGNFGVREMGSVLRRALRTGGYLFPNQRANEIVMRIMEQAGLQTCREAVLALLVAAVVDEQQPPAAAQTNGAEEPAALFAAEGTKDPL